jgi:hypothetical protein
MGRTVRKDGLVGGATMWGRGQMCVYDGRGCRKIEFPSLCGERSRPIEVLGSVLIQPIRYPEE